MRRITGRLVAAVLSAGVAVLAAVALAPAHAMPGVVELRVLTLNVLYGGDELDLHNGRWCARPDGCPETLAQVVETIEASGADVVGLEEAERNSRAIADALGWPYVSERTQVISRYPLIDPPGANGMYVFVELAPGEVAAISNVHLTSDPYGPYAVRDGATASEVLALEQSVRLPELQPRLAVLPSLAAAGIPVFLVGDFNAPSHLDWTPAVAAVRPEVRYPLEWPVSLAAEQAGLRDSYREAHPNPVTTPGFTWTPGGPESARVEVHDRIDLVLAAGPATTLASEIVGEAGGPDVDIEVDPYPTDHRGVVSTFAVTPGVPPLFVAVESRRLVAGDPLGVVFHAAGLAGERIAVVPAGGAASGAVATQATGAGAPTDGRVTFSTAVMQPGAYEAVLLAPADAVVSRSPFWLYAPGSRTEVAVGKAAYGVGEPIDVSWRNARGMRWDWVSIYKPGNADEKNPVAQGCNAGGCTNSRYLYWLYTGASVEGSAVFSSTSGFPGAHEWPLGPGTYEVQLLLDDGYRVAASSTRFKIVR